MNNTLILKNKISKKSFIVILKLLIVSALIYYLVSVLDFTDLLNTLAASDLTLSASAAVLLIVNIYFQFLKWKISCRHFLSVDDNSRIVSSLFSGFTAAVFTPARIGEYVGRGIGFQDKGIKNITAAVFYDKLFTLLFVTIFGIAGILFYISIHYIIALIIFSLLVIILYRKYSQTIVRNTSRINFIKKFYQKIAEFKTPDKKLIKEQLLFSFCFYTVYIIQFALLLSAFTGSINPLFFIIAVLIMFVKTYIPNVISGEFGIRESAAVFFMTLFGEDPNAGFNASIFLFLINIIIPAIPGIIPLLRNRNG
jgi:uncharacterized membrane protein YbhN (UPF0104 family)